MDETQRHYVEQMKPNTKEYILYDYVNMKFKNRQNYSMVIESNCSGCGEEKRGVSDWLQGWHERVFLGDGIIPFFSWSEWWLQKCIYLSELTEL